MVGAGADSAAGGEATRLGPGQRTCRGARTRLRPLLHAPAAGLGPIRPSAPSASASPRPSISASEPQIGRNRENRPCAETGRSRPPGRVRRCPLAFPRGMDLLSDFACLAAAPYPKRADINGHIAAGRGGRNIGGGGVRRRVWDPANGHAAARGLGFWLRPRGFGLGGWLLLLLLLLLWAASSAAAWP